MPERPPAPPAWAPAANAGTGAVRKPAAAPGGPAPAGSSMTWLSAAPASAARPVAPARAVVSPGLKPPLPPTVKPTPLVQAGASPTVRPALRPPAPPANTANTAHWQLPGKPGDHLVLMPGQMHVGPHVASLRTLLGSCVAITLWHPQRRIGGMCHFLLPQRSRRGVDALDGRYGDEAVEAMVKTLLGLRADPKDCVAHLYGGADTLSGHGAGSFNIGERNIEKGWALIDHYGFNLDGVDVGEDVPRTVTLDLAGGGEVSMRRGAGTAPNHLRGDATPLQQTGALGAGRSF